MVCLHHFADEDVLRDAATYDEKGELVTAKLQQLRIKDGAVPSIFPNCSKYLSKEVIHRTSPETKRKQKENLQLSAVLNESLQTAALFEQEAFEDWDELNSCIKNLKVSSYWDIIKRDKCIIFLHISTDPSPVIEKSIVIDSSLKLTIHVEKLPLVKVGNFSLPFVCNNICDIEDILTTLENCVPFLNQLKM
ncbi:hypothetical protein JTE90_022792 [Oedothorax gibbosus]|uniref:Uncharacterized protein n=1 Tax=Oedothorax gibbosus TaxID=931172 RepID=A0AAV6UA01_9ARAC|nr:hypothetical protein JTE90_022792 [Oedothorax gibbosus]